MRWEVVVEGRNSSRVNASGTLEHDSADLISTASLDRSVGASYPDCKQKKRTLLWPCENGSLQLQAVRTASLMWRTGAKAPRVGMANQSEIERSQREGDSA